MARIKGMTLENIMKPTIYKCAKCGGKLYVIPYRDGKEIKTHNICGNCSFKEDAVTNPIQESKDGLPLFSK